MYPYPLLLAALAIGTGFVFGQSCYDAPIESCQTLTINTCTKYLTSDVPSPEGAFNSCNCAAYEDYSTCFSKYCTGAMMAEVSAQGIAFCQGGNADVITFPGECDIGYYVDNCAGNYVPNCQGMQAFSSCYPKYCTGPVPADVIGGISFYCGAGQSQGASTAAPTGPATVIASTTMANAGQSTSSGTNSADNNSGTLSLPAKIGVGVGAGVGGVLAIAGVILILVKGGVFAGAGAGAAAAGVAGVAGVAAAGGSGGGGASVAEGSGGAASGTSAAPPGDMTMAGKMGLYGYTPGGYVPTGAEGGGGFSGYGPTGGEFGSQAPPSGFGGPTGTEGTAFGGPGPTGAEGSNFTAPGPTGSEGSNFTAPGSGSHFTAPGPTGSEGSNFTPPGHPSTGSADLNHAYFAIPAALAPLAAGAALVGRRRPIGGGEPLSPLSSRSASPQTQPQGYQPHVYQPYGYPSPNSQHELGGEGTYYGSELGAQEASYMFAQEMEDGHRPR